jgi:hypothetical protein
MYNPSGGIQTIDRSRGIYEILESGEMKLVVRNTVVEDVNV